MNEKDPMRAAGFRFLSEPEAEFAMRNAFSKNIPFAAFRSQIPDVTAAFIIQDKHFPYTGAYPVKAGEPGLRWNMQMGNINNHLIFYNEIEDEDRTYEKTEFTLVFCPNYPGTDKLLEDICKCYDKYNKKAKMLIVGMFMFGVLSKRPHEAETEGVLHPDLMRHHVLGEVDISVIPFHLLNQLMMPAARVVDRISAKYCPACKEWYGKQGR